MRARGEQAGKFKRTEEADSLFLQKYGGGNKKKVVVVQGLGFEWEPLVTAVSRGFPGPDLIGALRQRCSIPLLALMDRRFSQYNELAVNRRKALSDELGVKDVVNFVRGGS